MTARGYSCLLSFVVVLGGCSELFSYRPASHDASSSPGDGSAEQVVDQLAPDVDRRNDLDARPVDTIVDASDDSLKPDGATTSTHGQSCSGQTDCGENEVCVMLDSSDSTAMCFQVCQAQDDCHDHEFDAQKSICVLGPGGTQHCTQPCDPMAGDPCPDGTQCSIFVDANQVWTNCAAEVSASSTSDCVYHHDCPQGMCCLAGFCVFLCETDDNCTGNNICDAFSDGLPIGNVTYGFCMTE